MIRNSIACGLTAIAGIHVGVPTAYAQQSGAAAIESEVTTSSSVTGSANATGEGQPATGYRIESSSQNGEVDISRVFNDDRIVATYHSDLEGTPGFYPLLSPSGLPLTRNFPMEPFGAAKGNSAAATRFENQDHPHHRSMWFDHGVVNGIDFWALTSPGKVGRVVQRSEGNNVVQSSTLTDGVATTSEFCELITENDWIGPDDRRVLSDQREFRFHEYLGDTVMDVTVKLIASDGDVTFGDTKEGSLGVRVAGTMKVDANLGGEINNAEGLKDGDTWAKVSNWVDYSGPIAPSDLPESDAKLTAKDAADWERAGITMMYHPANELPECYWHVRTYGLFAANPFGRHHFGAPAYDGVKIEEGESLTLHFRMVIHDGAFDQEKTQQHFEAYAAETLR